MNVKLSVAHRDALYEQILEHVEWAEARERDDRGPVRVVAPIRIAPSSTRRRP